MDIIVTGATGFLGTSLAKRLEQQGHRVVRLNSKNCDLTKTESLYRFEGTFDQIYHLAAWTQAGDFCLHHPGEQWIINQKINTNVLSWWQDCQPQAKMIAMGTSCGYAHDVELIEENYLDGVPIESLYSYAMTKRMLYVGLQSINKQFGLNYLYAIPSTLYGPEYHTDGRQLHFIFDLIRKILLGKHQEKTVTLWGDGHQGRELVHVDDFVDVLLHINEHVTNDIVNIGSSEEYTIREFAGMLCDIIGYDADLIQYDISKYTGAKSKCLRTDKLNALLPGLQLRPIRDGLADTVRWFEENLELLTASG